MFSPRFAGQIRDRTRNADGTPRAITTLPVLSDDDARWYFTLDPDAAPAQDDAPAPLSDAQTAEWDAYLRTLERGTPTTYRVSRWWCGSCSGFVKPNEQCGRCGHAGPHHHGEDAPTTGNAARRARLKSSHRTTRSIHR